MPLYDTSPSLGKDDRKETTKKRQAPDIEGRNANEDHSSNPFGASAEATVERIKRLAGVPSRPPGKSSKKADKESAREAQ